jgi:Family of unknown function (DUF6074)
MTIPAAQATRSRRRAKIVRFPLARQQPLVTKLARQMARQIPARAEKTLHREFQRRIDALHRQGLSDQAVEREVRAFESAIRAELWRLVLLPELPDGAA